ncbi:hypothetical protein FRAHR75_1260010 [Frankia sp. Hr75.2]|nr:hypothetical protein FRAHR75_1260010 [Frankia sp. Hr75.2]
MTAVRRWVPRAPIAGLGCGHAARPTGPTGINGHANPSMTLSTYLGRKVSNPGAAETLSALAF